jgi:hypothetical protein
MHINDVPGCRILSVAGPRKSLAAIELIQVAPAALPGRRSPPFRQLMRDALMTVDAGLAPFDSGAVHSLRQPVLLRGSHGLH